MSQNIEEFPIIEELEASRRRSDDADDDGDNDDAFTLLSFKKDIKRMMCSKKALVGTGGFDQGLELGFDLGL